MNFTLEKQDALNGTLTVEIAPEDYNENYTKSLKQYAKQVNMPGFRPGHVPMNLVKRRFGQGILAEEIERLLRQETQKYLKENKVDILGMPLASEDKEEVKIEEGASFTFTMDLAFPPAFDVALGKDDTLPYYEVTVSEEQVSRQIEMYRQRGGSYDKVDSYQDNDMLKGTISQLDADGSPKEDGVNKEGVVMLPKYFKNEEQKAIFATAKQDDVIRFNPAQAYDNSPAELASLLGVDKEKAAEYTGDFNFQITEITRFFPGPLNQKLFDEVFPGGEVKTEDDFKTKIKEQIEGQFKEDSRYKFQIDLRKYLLEKVGKLEFPEEKLKRIVLLNMEDSSEEERKKQLDNFGQSLEALSWELIEEKVAKQFGVKVEEKDIHETARETVRAQFAQYGMVNIPDEYIEDGAKRMLGNAKELEKLAHISMDRLVAAAAKEAVTLQPKQVTSEEFGKLFDEE